MTYGHLSLRNLICAGPEKPPATLDFADGANAIIGLSNTGKSFVLELIDYLLGGEELQRLTQIPELEGYDTALLTLQHSDHTVFTLRRALNGGDIHVLEGAVAGRAGGKVVETIVRRDRKSGQPRSFSQFFLGKLNISDKTIRKSDTETNRLTFRPVIRLSIVDEERIISKASPALSGQFVTATSEKSIFKFLVTGTDDSALVLYSEQSKVAQQKTDQANVAQRLLSHRRQQLEAEGLDEKSLRDELAKVEATLANAQEDSQAADGKVSGLRRRSRRLAEFKELAKTRVRELDALLERFKLLDEHYASDIDRLTAIAEAAKNLDAIAPGPCPLCGAPPEAHQSTAGCAADLAALAEAANAEVRRIKRLRADLRPTIEKALAEKDDLIRRGEEADVQVSEVNRQLAPALEAARAQRASYAEAWQQWASLKENLRAFDAVKDFEQSAAVLKREADEMLPAMPDVAISRASTDGFAQEVASILKAWSVPETDRVAFDHQAYDLQLNSRLRGGQGKGLRALTHAAFSIALMTHCLKNSRPHPGFVILDSPLLSYRGEEHEPDPAQDLKSTTVDQAFYRWLASDLKHGQVVVIENRDPPQDVRRHIHLHEFLAGSERKGFIPS